ncbi:ATP-binding protein [Streptomyces sp. NRRL S-350]|uniref:ATP-binding protein n=1 Tax=Streptomyces sp. NRRL S-350 TaxID=1463902 RepID=UPI000690277F|nr:ATP-binding protein [Streptomyces sp. NRRL S-350]
MSGRRGRLGRVYRLAIDATDPDLEVRLGVVGPVREKLDNTLKDWGIGRADRGDMMWIAHELVANALRHSPPGRHLVSLFLFPGGDRLVVAVHDGSRAKPYLPADAVGNDGAESGRGMLLVAGLAEKWQADLTPHGKKVWAVLALQQPVPPLNLASITSQAVRRAAVIAAVASTSRLCAVRPSRAVA